MDAGKRLRLLSTYWIQRPKGCLRIDDDELGDPRHDLQGRADSKYQAPGPDDGDEDAGAGCVRQSVPRDYIASGSDDVAPGWELRLRILLSPLPWGRGGRG